jgi:hypothetical protein
MSSQQLGGTGENLKMFRVKSKKICISIWRFCLVKKRTGDHFRQRCRDCSIEHCAQQIQYGNVPTPAKQALVETCSSRGMAGGVRAQTLELAQRDAPGLTRVRADAEALPSRIRKYLFLHVNYATYMSARLGTKKEMPHRLSKASR